VSQASSLLLLAALTFAGAVVCGANGDKPAADVDNSGAKRIWRIPQLCGVNSLYVMLSCHGIRPDYSRLREGLSADGSETTLAQLKEAAASHGLRAVVARATPDALGHLPVPFIAHQELVRGRGDSGGHYCVVYRVEGDRVGYLDGSTAILKSARLDDFANDWTGYVLYVPEKSTGSRWWLPLVIGACSGAFISALWRHGAPCRARFTSRGLGA